MNYTEENYKELLKIYQQIWKKTDKLTLNLEFSGPSVHFHQRALEEGRKNFLSKEHLEMIYATVATWGLHRMGKGKTKMVDFEIFKENVLAKKETLDGLKEIRIQDLDETKLNSIIKKLDSLITDIKVSIGDSPLVATSKTLAHILPDLVPPIDRQYTIRFFSQSPSNFFSHGKYTTIPNFNESNKENATYTRANFFKNIMEKTWEFSEKISADNEIYLNDHFNTSYPKIFDNFIIQYIKEKEIQIKPNPKTNLK